MGVLTVYYGLIGSIFWLSSISTAFNLDSLLSLARKLRPEPECHLRKHWTTRPFNLSIEEEQGLSRWGSYRPEVYFGMKTKTNFYSHVTGIMWQARGSDGLRHTTRDGELANVFWTRNDGKQFGEEVLIDRQHDVDINATFLVTEDTSFSWIQRFQINVGRKGANFFVYNGLECHKKSELQYCKDLSKYKIKHVTKHELSDKVVLSIGGFSSESGKFVIHMYLNRPNKCFEDVCFNEEYTSFIGCDAGGGIWDEIVAIENGLLNFNQKKQKSKHVKSKWFDISSNEFLDDVSDDSSLFMTMLKFPPTADKSNYIVTVAMFESQDFTDFSTFKVLSQSLVVNMDLVDTLISHKQQQFDDRFESKFNLSTKGFIRNGVTLPFSHDEILLARNTMSSLIGGIGYFFGSPEIGDSIEANKTQSELADVGDKADLNNPIALFSATPSRTIFPRGFLWDEGFHQLIVSKWDWKLSISILDHWLSTMLIYNGPNPADCSGGWIPREMILGDHARTRVPSEFITQRVDIANPPTFFLLVDSLLKNFENSPENKEILAALNGIFDALDTWLKWYLRTQNATHQSLDGSFRWRGRYKSDKKIIPNTLASGLDDYPRSPIPSDQEAHVDLHSWMALSCRVMAKLASKPLLNRDSYSFYKEKSNNLLSSLYRYHWKQADSNLSVSGFFDVGLDSNQNRYQLFVVARCLNNEKTHYTHVQVPADSFKDPASICSQNYPVFDLLYPNNNNPQLFEKFVTIDAKNMSQIHTNRIGYVNLFPFLLQIIPVSDIIQLEAVVRMIESPDMLWTNFGLRSISKSDIFYMKKNSEHDNPYWRGPIWININYLAISALDHYRKYDGALQQKLNSLYHELRNNVVHNLLLNLKTTGFLWEQYDDSTGEGMRGHPFSGWTALLINLMAEAY